jgi:hypothetical protein
MVKELLARDGLYNERCPVRFFCPTLLLLSFQIADHGLGFDFFVFVFLIQ